MKARARVVLVLLFVLSGATAAYAGNAPKLKLPAHAPKGKKLLTAGKPLSASQVKKLSKGCPQFAAAQKKSSRGWICMTNSSGASSSWSNYQLVTYGIGKTEIGSIKRGVNIKMSGETAQHGISFTVATGPPIRPYWAADCLRFANPDDHANCGKQSGNATGWVKSYSHGWNFTPFRGNSQMRTVYSFAVYSEGHPDPSGQHGAFVLASVTSALYQCPLSGSTYVCKVVGK